MAGFDELLQDLHNDGSTITMRDTENAIEITTQRQFNVPEGFDTVIGYEGDINSQIITFKHPESYEGHPLSKCDVKELRWYNTSAGIEGTSELTSGENNTLIWQVPREVLSKAGTIELAISFYDYDKKDNKIAFAWNTPVFNRLSVGASVTNVGLGTVENKMPAKDEILFIDLETRNIIAPKAYNYVIGNLGEEGCSFVYFETNRYYHGKDLSDAKITVWAGNDEYSHTTEIKSRWEPAYPADYQREKVFGFVWEVPTDITNNSNFVGNFTIIVTFKSEEKAYTLKSTPFSKLILRDAPTETSVKPVVGVQYVLDGNTFNYDGDKTVLPGIVQLRNREIYIKEDEITEPAIRSREMQYKQFNDGEEKYIDLVINTGDTTATTKNAISLKKGVVQYIAQDLLPEQQAQARDNIGAGDMLASEFVGENASKSVRYAMEAETADNATQLGGVNANAYMLVSKFAADSEEGKVQYAVKADNAIQLGGKDASTYMLVSDFVGDAASKSVQLAENANQLNGKGAGEYMLASVYLTDGKINSDFLPSYVDDVLEFDTKSNFPSKGETGKIYLDIYENKTYRWGGEHYVVIASDLALGETEKTAYPGNLGQQAHKWSAEALAYITAHIATINNPHEVTKDQVKLGFVENTGDSSKPDKDGKEKFTTGGAFELQQEIAAKVPKTTKINGVSLEGDNITLTLDKFADATDVINAKVDARIGEYVASDELAKVPEASNTELGMVKGGVDVSINNGLITVNNYQVVDELVEDIPNDIGYAYDKNLGVCLVEKLINISNPDYLTMKRVVFPKFAKVKDSNNTEFRAPVVGIRTDVLQSMFGDEYNTYPSELKYLCIPYDNAYDSNLQPNDNVLKTVVSNLTAKGVIVSCGAQYAQDASGPDNFRINHFDTATLRTLLNDYADLQSSYTNLQSSYTDLQNSYNTLDSNYTKLQNSYNTLYDEIEGLKTSIQNIFTAGDGEPETLAKGQFYVQYESQ